MYGIHIGDEQIPFESSEVRRDGWDDWVFGWNELEFVVAGSPDGTNEMRFEFARRVALHAKAIVSAANEYLSALIEKGRFEASGDWMGEGFEFGKNPLDPLNEFEVSLVIDGDHYGLWRVRFRDSEPPIGCSPVAFSRHSH